MPFLPPNQQCQSTEGKALKAKMLTVRKQKGQHLLTGQHATNFRLLANQ